MRNLLKNSHNKLIRSYLYQCVAIIFFGLAMAANYSLLANRQLFGRWDLLILFPAILIFAAFYLFGWRQAKEVGQFSGPAWLVIPALAIFSAINQSYFIVTWVILLPIIALLFLFIITSKSGNGKRTSQLETYSHNKPFSRWQLLGFLIYVLSGPISYLLDGNDKLFASVIISYLIFPALYCFGWALSYYRENTSALSLLLLPLFMVFGPYFIRVYPWAFLTLLLYPLLWFIKNRYT